MKERLLKTMPLTALKRRVLFPRIKMCRNIPTVESVLRLSLFSLDEAKVQRLVCQFHLFQGGTHCFGRQFARFVYRVSDALNNAAIIQSVLTFSCLLSEAQDFVVRVLQIWV